MITKREEVLETIIKSIKHWEKDILKPLLEGGKIVKDEYNTLLWENDKTRVACSCGDCPLCQKYMASGNSCRKCPYFIYYGKPCHSEKEPWFNFFVNPNIETAKAMIEKLKHCSHYKPEENNNQC